MANRPLRSPRFATRRTRDGGFVGMYERVPIETQGRIAADMALDILEMYRSPATTARQRVTLRSELRRLEPLVALAAARRITPFRRRVDAFAALDDVSLVLKGIRDLVETAESHIEFATEPPMH